MSKHRVSYDCDRCGQPLDVVAYYDITDIMLLVSSSILSKEQLDEGFIICEPCYQLLSQMLEKFYLEGYPNEPL